MTDKPAIGTIFDDIVVEVQRDYHRRELGIRRHHVFLLSAGRHLVPCRGPGFCRECNRERTAEVIEKAKTAKGGWTRETLAGWGVAWPPPKGWKERLIAGGVLA